MLCKNWQRETGRKSLSNERFERKWPITVNTDTHFLQGCGCAGHAGCGRTDEAKERAGILHFQKRRFRGEFMGNNEKDLFDAAGVIR
jgi:hypothetical protein